MIHTISSSKFYFVYIVPFFKVNVIASKVLLFEQTHTSTQLAILKNTVVIFINR